MYDFEFTKAGIVFFLALVYHPYEEKSLYFTIIFLFTSRPQISLCDVKQPNMAWELLTLACVGHLQVLIGADTRVSKHRVARSDNTAVFSITAVDTD